jgi:hypothetical protein
VSESITELAPNLSIKLATIVHSNDHHVGCGSYPQHAACFTNQGLVNLQMQNTLKHATLNVNHGRSEHVEQLKTSYFPVSPIPPSFPNAQTPQQPLVAGSVSIHPHLVETLPQHPPTHALRAHLQGPCRTPIHLHICASRDLGRAEGFY